MKHYVRATFLLALAVGCAPATAQTVVVPVVQRPPELADYRQSGPVQGELVVTGFVQRDPNDGEPVSESTTAYLSRDQQHLYVAFRCLDARPHAIRARLSPRDQIAQDDQVVVYLDTFHDRQRAYVFRVNPLGIQADASLSEGRPDDPTFDTVWASTGERIPDGFIVLLAIPFKSLRTDPTQTAWGLALGRVLPRRSEEAFWPPITGRVEGTTQQFADVHWDTPPSGNSPLQVIPYTAGTAARYVDRTSGAASTQREARVGVDAKIVVREGLTVDVAARPDFSQVESDQPQVNINQRFEVFYPERRPFFLENASLFRWSAVPPTRTLPDFLFFSRRIENPDVGVRLTGKRGSWALGGLAARDLGTDTTASGQGASGAQVVVGRAVRELGRQSSVGVFVTSRRASSAGNQVVAVDGRWKLGPNVVAVGQAAWSLTRGTAHGEPVTGTATNMAVLYTGRKVFATAFYSDRSPAFRAALGFVPRTDLRQLEHYGEYRWRPRTGPIVAIGPNSYGRLVWTYHGGIQEWVFRVPFQVDLKGRTSVFLRRVDQRERVGGVDLRQRFHTVTLTTEWISWLAVNESVEWGLTPNYTPRSGSPYLARSLNASLGVIVRPSPRLRLEPTYLLAWLTHDGVDGLASGDVFTNHIARARAQYQFSRAISGRAIVDYSAVLPNEQRVRLRRDKRLGVDALLTIQTGPSTALYAGYTTAWQNIVAGGEGSSVARTDPTALVGRQLFVKFSYLWRR